MTGSRQAFPAAAEAPRSGSRAPASRGRDGGTATLRLGVAAAVVGVLLAVLSVPGPGLLTVGVGALQLLLVLTVVVVVDAPARGGVVLLALVAAAAADTVVLRDNGHVDDLAGVVALALVAALLHQLTRRGRTEVTRSLADTLLAVVLSAAAACLLALRDGTGGRAGAFTALAAAAAFLLLHRVFRGLPALLLGLVAGAAVGALVGVASDDLPVAGGALLGLAAAAAVAVADRLVTSARVRAGRGERRRRAALRPVSVLLPYAVLGPVALVAGRLAVG